MHKHEWRRWGNDFRCQVCKDIMAWREQMRRLNATEELSAEDAKIALVLAEKMPIEFGDIKEGLVDALRAYADALNVT